MMIIPSLTDGGTERVVATLLPPLTELGHEVHLVLFQAIFEYPVPEGVRCTVLGKRSRWSLPRLVYQLARLIRTERPDVVSSKMTYANILAVIACGLAGYHGGIVVSEHSVPTHDIESERFPAVRSWLIRRLYRRSIRVLAISSGIAEDLVENFAVPLESIAVIHNPVDLTIARREAREPVDDPWLPSGGIPVICAVGRLAPEKDYPVLLHAVRRCVEQTPLRVLILGKGRELGRLQELASELGIEDSVRFLGQQRNVFAYISRCDALVLSSSYEGLGNVLLEAMACDTPVISTDCPCGPREIITDRVDGLLVPVGDAEALSSAILEVVGSPDLRQRLVDGGRRRVEKFDVPVIARQYSELFEEVSFR